MLKMTADRQTSRHVYLAGASMVALGVALAAPQPAQAAATITNSGGTISVSGGTTGAYVLPGNSTLFTITNTGTITTGAQRGLYNSIYSIGVLTNAGSIHSTETALNNGNLGVGFTGTLTNTGTISANGSQAAIAIENNATILVLLNGTLGVISGQGGGIDNGDFIGTLTNNGAIVGSIYGIADNNAGIGASSIGTLINTGTITGLSSGVSNHAGNIGTISNSGTIESNKYGIYNNSGRTIGGLGNSGTIQGSQYGIANLGSIGSLSNATGGTIIGGTIGISIGSGGTIGILSNSGEIESTVVSASVKGIVNAGMISIVSNTTGGTIAGWQTGIFNNSGATIGMLSNSGTIMGSSLSDNAIVNSGVINTLSNSGTITTKVNGGSNAITNNSGGMIGTLTNSGTIKTNGSGNGIFNQGSIISIVNSSTIFGGESGISNLSGFIGLLNNATGGTITASNSGISNSGSTPSIATLTNSGLITGSQNGISNNGGTIGTLINSIGGTIKGSHFAIYNSGIIGAGGAGATLTNTGVIAGNIMNGNADLSVAGATVAGLFGTLTGYAAGTEGLITNTSGSVVLSGNQVLNDSITASLVTNAGGNISLISIVSITGNYSQTTASGTLTEAAGAELFVSGSATMTNGTVVAVSSLSPAGNYAPGQADRTLVAGGAGSNYTGISIASSGITGLAETGGTVANNLVAIVSNYYVGGTLGSISNTLNVSGVPTPVYIGSNGTLGSLTNSGTLTGSNNGITNNGGIGSINNSGLISVYLYGIEITSSADSVGILTNSGTITSTNVGVINFGSLGTLTNSGTIYGHSSGIYQGGSIIALVVNAAGGSIGGGNGVFLTSNGSIGTLLNAGTIGGRTVGIYNSGGIGTVSNSGTIAGGTYGLVNAGSIAFVTVAAGGLIKDNVTAGLGNTGSIGAIALAGSITGQVGLGNTGTITSLAIAQTGAIIGVSSAIQNSGSLTTIANSGIIAGNIVNTSANDLSFTGGSGSTFGTFTGYTAGSQGTITGTTANVVFAAGQIFLNDAMNLGSHSFVNSGASIQINTMIPVTGNFVQTSGTLLIGASSTTSYGDIVVTGNATITGGTVSVAAVGGFTLAPAQTYTIVQARGSLSVSGLTASVTNYVPVIQTITAGGYNDLILTLNTIGSTTTGNTGGGTTTGNTVTGTTGSGGGSGNTVTGTTGTVTGTTGTVAGTTTGTTTGTTSSGGSSGGSSTIVATLATYTALGNATGGVATGIGPALDRIAAGITPSVGVNAATSATDQQFYTSVLAPLNALPTAAAKHTAITQLSPGQLTPQAAPIAVTPALDAITEHQNTLPGATDGPGVLSRGAGAGSDGQQGALWGQLLAGNATRDQSNGAAGYGATTYGVLAGADFEVTPELLAGVAIDWITSRVTGNDALAGSNTRLSSYQFEGYGSWRPDRFDGRLTFDGQLGFGENSYNQHRAISYLNLGANAHFDGQQYVASVLAGYRLDIQGPVEVAPYLRLRETHLVNGGYSESGAGLADLAVNGITTDSFTHELGVKAGMEFDTTYGKWFPAVKLGWIHDYTNGPIALTGNLLGGTVFTSATSQPGADGAALGLTLDLKRTDSFSLSIEYDGEYHKDFTSNTGLVNGTWKF